MSEEQPKTALEQWLEDSTSLVEDVFNEIEVKLREREFELIKVETNKLVAKNQALGGSEHGYYYRTELFVVAGAYGKDGIEEIDPSLHEEAEMLRLNRSDVRQYLTYTAHLLGALKIASGENPTIFCVNVPEGLLQFSKTLTELDRTCQKEDGDFYAEAKFHEKDKTKAAFFAHYNRVNGAINRFLFRRLAH